MYEPTFSVSAFTTATNTSSTSSSAATTLTHSTPPVSPTPPKNPVTCAAVSSKFVVLGLSDGSVALYDVFGNLLDLHAHLHSTPVTAVTLGGGPAADSVVASAAANGDIRVARLSSTSSSADQQRPAMLSSASVAFTKSVDNPVLALAIDPSFGKPRFGERIAFSDASGRVVIYTSGWFGGSDLVVNEPKQSLSQQTSPQKGQTTASVSNLPSQNDNKRTPVLSLAWVHNLLAYPYADGVQVYDTRNTRLVCRVAAPGVSQPASPSLDRPMPLLPELSIPPLSTQAHSRPSSTNSNDHHPPSHASDPIVDDIPPVRPGRTWPLHTRVYMDVDESVPLSAQGEPAVRLFLTWPSGARIVRVGAQAPVAGHYNVPPAREIDVIFKLERHALIVPHPPLGDDNKMDNLINDDVGGAMNNEPAIFTESESPLLSVVPFGGEEDECVALVGLPSGQIRLHLISRDGQNVKHMTLPPEGRLMRDANLLPVPGGDPLVLVLAYPDEKRMEESKNELIKVGADENKNYEKSGSDEKKEKKYGSIVGDDDDDEDDEKFSIAAPADILYVRSLTTAERVKWLLSEDRFLDALSVAQSAPGGSLRRAEVSLVDIGEQFLESLKDAGDYDRLVSVLGETIATTSPFAGLRTRDKVLSKRRRRWERWIDTFRNSNQLAVVAPVVPTYEPLLPTAVYTDILANLAASNPSVMVTVLKTWPAEVFDVSAVTKAIEAQLSVDALPASSVSSLHLSANSSSTTTKVKKDIKWPAQEREALNEGLLMMYALSGRHDETLLFLLRDQSPKVYDYIRSHHLYEAVRSAETITGLYEIDPAEATDVLVRAPETVLPPDAVVPLLNKVDNSQWTFMYLHAMFRMDTDQAPKYHNTLLRLYVKHGTPGTLYNFLRTSTHYSLDVALEAMGGPKGKPRGALAKERVYVLSAMGDLNSAMDILLDELADTFAAIDFATDHADPVLWERLIDHAKTHADTLAALLDSPAGGKVDPVRLVPLLTSEMRIPNLRDRLHRILVDAALERALREDAAAALQYDAGQLLQQLDECVAGHPS